MAETRQYLGFGDVEKILAKSYKSITGGHEFDIDKYGPYVDAVKRVLVPSLEKQILFFLERFVYNEDFQQSSYQRYLSRYKESMLTAYTKYNDIGTSIEAVRDSLTMDNLVDFLGYSLLTNSRLAKISNDLNNLGIEKNWLGYVNVFNYVNEKDFWVCPSSSGTSRQYSSICSASNNNILSDVNAEKGSHVAWRTRGHKRPRKRAATHISRKHYKLERLAQLSEKSFKVTESLYDLLKSNWILHDSLYTKRKLKRNNCDLRRSSFSNYQRKYRRNDWKHENLTFVIRKINGQGNKTIGDEIQGNSEVRTSISLPCKVGQLLCKLERVDSSVTRSHCSFIRKKFQIKLYNVCSCLNNLLSRMNIEKIISIYLICEIRRDYLSLKLKAMPSSNCNSSLFSARLMTCEALYRYGIRKSGPRQRLKSQSVWAAKKADELSTGIAGSGNVSQRENLDLVNDAAVSSVEITFIGCETSAKDPQNVERGLTCGPEDLVGLTLRDSSSISNVVQKLELSPFRLQETQQSFKMRSKIQDIVRSIMICTREHSLPGRGGRESISIQAIISTSSLQAMKNGVQVLPVESKSPKSFSASKIVSYIESKIYPSRSREAAVCKEYAKPSDSADPKGCRKLTGSSKSKKSVTSRDFLEMKEQSVKCGGAVRPNKSLKKCEASLPSRETAKLKYKNKYKICTTYEKPIRSEEFTGSMRQRSLSEKIVKSIASEISNALARTESNGSRITEDQNDHGIDVTVEIGDSSRSSHDSTESISRHTHILPSMKSVKLGTNSKYFLYNCERSTSLMSSSSSLSSSSESKVLMLDNCTTMNKSMIPSSNRGTISAKSYDRIKHLLREKVCKKLSETDSCQPNSSKTIVSNGKYYLSIPSSKTSRILLKREISESSSTSHDGSQLPACNRGLETSRTSPSDDGSLSSSSLHRCLPNSTTQSSRAATFDRDSIYGCIEDRLANRYFRDIVHDYSDDTENSQRCRKVKPQILYGQFPRPDNCGLPSSEEKNRLSRYYDSEVSSVENETGFSQSFSTDSDARTKIIWAAEGIGRSRQCQSKQKFYANYVVGRAIAQRTPRLDDYKRFEKIEQSRLATGWSTCPIRSSSSRDCDIYRLRSNCRTNMRGRGDSRQQKTFVFEPGNIIKKYKKQFQNIDKSFRAKLTQYVGICKNVKITLQKHVCLNDIYEESRTSIPSSNFERRNYNGVYFGG